MIKETTSTQNELANIVDSGIAQSGEVIVAEYQSAGRGRLGRQFIAPPNSSLLFSFFTKTDIKLSWLPLIAGIGVCSAIPEAKLKWPNDIFLNGKKLGGILAEKVKSGVIIGIGVNVYQSVEELPIKEATSLALNNISCNRNDLLISILQYLGKLLRNWPSNKVDIKQNYLKLCTTIGQSVEAQLPNGEVVSGIASGITDSGALIVADREVDVGDIRHLK